MPRSDTAAECEEYQKPTAINNGLFDPQHSTHRFKLESATKPGNLRRSGLSGAPGCHRNGESVFGTCAWSHGRATAGLALATLAHPSLCETDHHPAKQAQADSGLWVADAAVVLAQGCVERVMQAAFDDPATPLELEKTGGIQLFAGQNADEVDDLGGLLPVAPDPPLPPRKGLHSGKATFCGVASGQSNTRISWLHCLTRMEPSQ